MIKRAIVVLIISMLILSGCSIKDNDNNSEKIKDGVCTISKEHNGINVSVNPNIELLSVVQFLSNYDKDFKLLTPYYIEYKIDVEDYFSKYKEHEAVKYFETLYKNGFTYDAPPTAMLFLDEQLELKEGLDYLDHIKERAGGEENLNEFARLLKKFYIDTEFNKFYENHREYYNKIIDDTIQIIGDKDYIKELEGYYGIKQNSYNIILASLFHTGGYGPKIELEKNSFDICSIIGPQYMELGHPFFGDKSSFKHIQRHEFGHSFVNYLSEEYEKEVESYEYLLDPIIDKMNNMTYGNWQTCLNEHIVRAIVIRMETRDNMLQASNLLELEKSNGFIYIDKIIDKLQEYEDNREKYETFEEFYPEILEVLD